LIVEFAEEAFHEKGEGLSRDDFLEFMVWNWLANKELVQREVMERRLERVVPPDLIEKDDAGSLLLFNKTGTVIRASPPHENGLRKIDYTPMHLRGSNPEIPLQSEGEIADSVAELGGFYSTTVFSTSGIELLYKSKPESERPTVALMEIGETLVVEPEK